MKILHIGDIFGTRGKEITVKLLPKLIKEHQIDFVVAQGENITDRKGLDRKDFELLTKAGINAFTMGNHVWAIREVRELIKEKAPIIPPFNTNEQFGKGSQVFKVNGQTLRITSIMGIAFNKLLFPWKQKYANNFFDALDDIIRFNNADFHLIDFHAETTSEKNVLSLYVDGKVNGFVGTHTHVQTNDYKTLPKGTAYISDVGMTGPANCAIGANVDEVYRRMRFNERTRFVESDNDPQFNAVVLEFVKEGPNKITAIRIDP